MKTRSPVLARVWALLLTTWVSGIPVIGYTQFEHGRLIDQRTGLSDTRET